MVGTERAMGAHDELLAFPRQPAHMLISERGIPIMENPPLARGENDRSGT